MISEQHVILFYTDIVEHLRQMLAPGISLRTIEQLLRVIDHTVFFFVKAYYKT